MDNDTRDYFIATLLTSNKRRPAWPISAVLPLMRSMGATISYDDFVSLLWRIPSLSDATWEEARNLTRIMWAEEDRERTVWEHLTCDYPDDDDDAEQQPLVRTLVYDVVDSKGRVCTVREGVSEATMEHKGRVLRRKVLEAGKWRRVDTCDR